MNKKIIIGIALAFLLLVAIGFTYAYFSGEVTGNDDAQDNIVETGTLSLLYKDGPEVTLDNAYPGDSITKTFTVTNTGTLDTTYIINLANLINTITNDELVIEATCTSYTGYVDADNKGTVSGVCEGITETPIIESSTETTSAVKEEIAISPEITHEYTLTITFIETNDTQNYNQGKTFSSTIQIDSTESNGVWYENCAGKNTVRCAMLNNETAYADNVSSPYVTSTTGINFGALSSDTNGKGLYYTTDLTKTEDINGDGEGERVYYYRGAVENNYLVFAEKCWRVVRTNEDGSVKLRYQGTASNNTCSSTATAVTTMAFNTSYNDVAYSGYMYPNAPTTSSILNMSNDVVNANESNMKQYLDDWYDANLASYESRIADTIYCADRTISSGTNYYNFTNTKNPYGKNVVFFGGYERLAAETTGSTWKPRSDASPQYLCERMEDSFTKSSSMGNGKLDKAIGLITADEVAYAGGLFSNTDGSSANDSYYLNTGSRYWTMSPSDFFNTYASVFHVGGDGFGDIGCHANGYGVNNTGSDVLPAVSLNASTTVASSGTGTASNPYVVERDPIPLT